MKICYLADAGSTHTTRWATHFSSRGYEVEIVSYRRTQEPRLQANTHVINAGWHHFRLDPFVSVPQVREILKRSKPDIVHAHYASSYGTLGRLCGFHPYVLSVWGSDVFDFPRRSWIHRALIKKNLACADYLCSTSRAMASETQRYCSKAITVTPFGIDCERFRSYGRKDLPEDEFVVGTVKALERIYGVETLIQSFALLAKKCRDRKRTRLVIAGDGSRRKSLERLAFDLGVGSQVNFLGAIPHARVADVLNTFSVFCALSSAESFGVAVLEASACQVPVVVTNVGGLPEVVQNGVTGIVVSPGDIHATASSLERLMDETSLRTALGSAGRSFVLKNYEWSENASRMEQVYKSVLGMN
jgi:glycosyltransferase involved in cell wall biosynthesis